MKKLIVLVLVLSMATIANAGLQISVGGQINPPDTQISLLPSETVMIDIHGDGQTPGPYSLFLLTKGAGNMSGGGIVMSPILAISEFVWHNNDVFTAMLTANGFATTNAVYVNAVSALTPIPNYEGRIVDDIVFHCDAVGEVTLMLIHLDQVENPDTGDMENVWTTLDTQVIHQIPEPMTMVLLGLGGLFLRRRSK